MRPSPKAERLSAEAQAAQADVKAGAPGDRARDQRALRARDRRLADEALSVEREGPEPALVGTGGEAKIEQRRKPWRAAEHYLAKTEAAVGDCRGCSGRGPRAAESAARTAVGETEASLARHEAEARALLVRCPAGRNRKPARRRRIDQGR